MHFIRLAGCSVGAKATKDKMGDVNAAAALLPILSSGRPASFCQTYDERFFVCDTDFSLHEKLSVEQLITETYEDHICLTGGEPLMHQEKDYFDELTKAARAHHKLIHIETSGTILWRLAHSNVVWITVAPKFGYLDTMLYLADEVKILVDEDFDINKLPLWIKNHTNVFVCPINDEHEVNQTNVQLCLDLLRNMPTWRLSCQWHKFLQLR